MYELTFTDCTAVPLLSWKNYIRYGISLKEEFPIPYGAVVDYKCGSGFTTPSGDYSLTCRGGDSWEYVNEPDCVKSKSV